MAGSRLHKLQSIFERMKGLLESGVYKDVDKPVWYDVYQQHPPKYIPYYNRSAPDTEVKDIFYEEDIIRAKIHKVVRLRHFDLMSKKETSQTKYLIKSCLHIMNVKGVSVDEAIKRMDTQNQPYKKEEI